MVPVSLYLDEMEGERTAAEGREERKRNFFSVGERETWLISHLSLSLSCLLSSSPFSAPFVVKPGQTSSQDF